MTSPMKILIAEPHGFCAGVRRAVLLAEKALASPDATGNTYCLHKLVHNRLVVDRLSAAGMIFVDDVRDVPSGATLLFSAHGVAPCVREEARARHLSVIDATCVFVQRVHDKVRDFANQGYTIFLIGHANHDEIVGIKGEAPDSVFVIESVADAELATAPNPERVAVLTQTTLVASQAKPIIDTLKQHFPTLCIPAECGICLATTERQNAVRDLAAHCDTILVLGSPTSANTNRLADVARAEGIPTHLLADGSAVSSLIQSGALDSCRTIGLTSGASTPEDALIEAKRLIEDFANTHPKTTPSPP